MVGYFPYMQKLKFLWKLRLQRVRFLRIHIDLHQLLPRYTQCLMTFYTVSWVWHNNCTNELMKMLCFIRQNSPLNRDIRIKSESHSKHTLANAKCGKTAAFPFVSSLMDNPEDWHFRQIVSTKDILGNGALITQASTPNCLNPELKSTLKPKTVSWKIVLHEVSKD